MSPHYICVGTADCQTKIDHPRDLLSLDCIILDLPPTLTPWHFAHQSNGEKHIVETKGSLTISTPLGALYAACAGHGPTLLPQWLVREAIEKEQLVDLLPNWRGQMHETPSHLWLLHHPHRHMPQKIRAVRDFLHQHLTQI